jgi:hypothetical protein
MGIENGRSGGRTAIDLLPPRIHHDHAESVLAGIDADNLGVSQVHGSYLSSRFRASSIYPQKSGWTIPVSLFLECTPRSALINRTAILFPGPMIHFEPRAAFIQAPFATKSEKRAEARLHLSELVTQRDASNELLAGRR